MFFTRNNDHLHLRPWDYNACRTINRLSQLVKSEGGKVKPSIHNGFIRNRAVEGSEFIEVEYTTFISFVLDGYYFYYQLDTNPFFDFFATKTAVIDGKYNRSACAIQDKKEWVIDDFFRSTLTDEQVNDAAKYILEWLRGLSQSKTSENLFGKIDF